LLKLKKQACAMYNWLPFNILGQSG